MDTLIISLIVTIIGFGVPVFGLCPMSCDYKQSFSKCCQNETVTCCKGFFPTENCNIGLEAIRITTRELYIQDCTIKSFSSSSFLKKSGTNITKFIIENVRIESIADDAFHYFLKLKSFTLRSCHGVNLTSLGNAIKNITHNQNNSLSFSDLGILYDNISNIFIGNSESQNISLAYNVIEYLPLLELQDVRTLVVLDLNNNKISNISIPTKSFVNLTTLILKNNRIKQVKGNIWESLEDKFPNLEILDLQENSIEDLDHIPMRIFPYLKSLNLAGNHIKYLNFDVFKSLCYIEELDFSNNWLSNKSHNKTTIQSLKRLTLRSNHFPTFPPWLCNNDADETAFFPNLTYLDLSNNLIKYTITQAWACLKNLKELNLNGNPLRKITNYTFANLTNLETLHLSMLQGGLENIEPHAFNTSNLKNLFLESSGVMCLINSSLIHLFENLTQLNKLNLAFNKFPNLSESDISTLLSPLKSITYLNLSHVGISYLPKNLLGNFTDLKYLILDDNHFETRYLQNSFDSLKGLEFLSLVHNRITVICRNSFGFRSNRTLKEIDLSKNSFECTCSNWWFRRELDDSQNGIKYKNWATYECSSLDNNDSPKLFKDYHPTEKECEPLSEMMTAYITIACFLLVFSFTACLVYKFRWHITYWRYKMNRKNKGTKNPELRPILKKRHLKFDAYVIYKLDEPDIGKFMKMEFDPMVEQLGYKCFIWDRDAGVSSKISEMGDGIYGSRNVIAIVTNNFLKDPWCNFQIEVALDRQVELQRKTLIFIVMEDVDFQLLNKYWCVMFTKNHTVHWCSDTKDIKRNVLEALIQSTLGEPGQRT